MSKQTPTQKLKRKSFLDKMEEIYGTEPLTEKEDYSTPPLADEDGYSSDHTFSSGGHGQWDN